MSSLISVSVVKQRVGESSKFMYIISKKVSKKAVERNRLKRCFKKAIGDLGIKLPDGILVKVFVKAEACGATQAEISQEIAKYENNFKTI